MTSSQEPAETGQTPQPAVAPFNIGRAILVLLADVVLVSVVCIGVLRLAGWTHQIRFVVIGATVCGGAAILSLFPVWILSRKSVQGAAQGFLAGILIRMALCGGAVVILGRISVEDKAASSLWIAGWYMVVLMCELVLVGRYIKLSSGAKVGKTTDSVEPGHLKDENRQ